MFANFTSSPNCFLPTTTTILQNFKEREKEHKEFLKKKKKDKLLEKEKAKVETLVTMDSSDGDNGLDGGSNHSRGSKRESGIGLFMSTLSPKRTSGTRTRTSGASRIVGKLKPRSDMMSLWGIDSSSHHTKK